MQTKNIMLVHQMILNKGAVFLTVKYLHVNIGAYRLLQRYSALFFLCLPTNRPPSQTCLATTSVRVLVTTMFWGFFLRLIVLLREKRYCREQIGRNNRIKQQLLVGNVFSSPELSSISGQLMIATDW